MPPRPTREEIYPALSRNESNNSSAASSPESSPIQVTRTPTPPTDGSENPPRETTTRALINALGSALALIDRLQTRTSILRLDLNRAEAAERNALFAREETERELREMHVGAEWDWKGILLALVVLVLVMVGLDRFLVRAVEWEYLNRRLKEGFVGEL